MRYKPLLDPHEVVSGVRELQGGRPYTSRHWHVPLRLIPLGGLPIQLPDHPRRGTTIEETTPSANHTITVMTTID